MKVLPASYVFWLLTLIFIIENGVSHKQALSVIFLQAFTNRNPEYVSRYNITILPKAPGSRLTVEMDVIRNFTLTLMMKIMVFKKNGSNFENFRNIFAFDFNFCNLVSRQDERSKQIFDMNVGYILYIWVNNMKKYGNIPTCPIIQGSYSVHNFRVDKNGIPNFLPLGKYRVNVTFYFKDTQSPIFVNNSTLDLELRKKK